MMGRVYLFVSRPIAAVLFCVRVYVTLCYFAIQASRLMIYTL